MRTPSPTSVGSIECTPSSRSAVFPENRRKHRLPRASIEMHSGPAECEGYRHHNTWSCFGMLLIGQVFQRGNRKWPNEVEWRGDLRATSGCPPEIRRGLLRVRLLDWGRVLASLCGSNHRFRIGQFGDHTRPCAPRSLGRACAGAVDHGRVLPDGDLRCVRLNLPSLVGAGGLNIVRHDRFRFVSPSRRRPCAACGELFMRGASRAPP